MLGIFTVFTQAKGKIATQFVGVLYFFFYIFLALSNEYFGEVIIYAGLMIPIYIYGILHWLKNKDAKNNVVIVRRNLPKGEWLALGFGLPILAAGMYFLLHALNTAEVLMSTITFVALTLSVYLLARRMKINQVAFLASDFSIGLLWLFAILNGDLAIIPFCVTCFIYVVYDVYGLSEWTKLERRQKDRA